MSHVPPNGSGQRSPLTNASGTIIATAKPFGTAPAINLADSGRDYDTLMNYRGQWLTVKSLIGMGVLNRQGATLTENMAFRQGGGGDGTQPRPFPF